MATELNEALAIAEQTGYPVVLKSQVLVGGRGKAGGIKKAKTRQELEKAFGELKALSIKGYPVEKILIVRAVDIQKEFYLGATVDNVQGDVVLIASSEGGVEIEEVAKTNPGAIQKCYLRREKRIGALALEGFIDAVFKGACPREVAAKIVQGLVDVFFQYDCSLAEINPLVIDAQGNVLAADAKINFDDNALPRHEDMATLRDMRYEDPDELRAKECGLSFVKLEGNVGCIVNGAGLAMATMDIIKLVGGQPANFLDVGGSSNPEKVLNALKIILNNKNVKAILINIFGGITRCDDIANGILQAKAQIAIPVPLVVRLTGTNEKEAKQLLARHHIETYSTMRQAVEQVVALAQ